MRLWCTKCNEHGAVVREIYTDGNYTECDGAKLPYVVKFPITGVTVNCEGMMDAINIFDGELCKEEEEATK